jgi:MerR family transcriptional regulator/heat shock protein HspR
MPEESESPPTDQGVYGIGVAADLVGTAIQNLRAYERAGLVHPDRTAGGNRLYSPDDVARLRRIQVLLAEGLNLAGIAQVLDLQDDNQRLRDHITTLIDPLGLPDGKSSGQRSDPTPPVEDGGGNGGRPHATRSR